MTPIKIVVTNQYPPIANQHSLAASVEWIAAIETRLFAKHGVGVLLADCVLGIRRGANFTRL